VSILFVAAAVGMLTSKSPFVFLFGGGSF